MANNNLVEFQFHIVCNLSFVLARDATEKMSIAFAGRCLIGRNFVKSKINVRSIAPRSCCSETKNSTFQREKAFCGGNICRKTDSITKSKLLSNCYVWRNNIIFLWDVSILWPPPLPPPPHAAYKDTETPEVMQSKISTTLKRTIFPQWTRSLFVHLYNNMNACNSYTLSIRMAWTCRRQSTRYNYSLLAEQNWRLLEPKFDLHTTFTAPTLYMHRVRRMGASGA